MQPVKEFAFDRYRCILGPAQALGRFLPQSPTAWDAK
jgi:hypothetical protein